MNLIEIQQLKSLIVATSLYYGQEVKDSVLALYVEDLIDLPFADVVSAIREVRRDPKTIRFPLPAVIRQRIEPTFTAENEAVEIASRIAGAVARVGPYDSPGARRFVGEVGWAVIQMEGGWENICASLDYDNMTTQKAQWRNLAKSQIERKSNRGSSWEVPQITSVRSGGLQLLGEGIGKQIKRLEGEDR